MDESHTQQLSRQISIDLQFFKASPLLSFEKDKVLQTFPMKKGRESLFTGGDSSKYLDRHPQLCAPDPSTQNVFRGTIPITFDSIKLFDVPTESNQSFFIEIQVSKSPLINGWFLISDDYKVFFNESDNSAEPLPKGETISITDRRYLKVGGLDKKFFFCSNNSNKSESKGKKLNQDIINLFEKYAGKKRCLSYEFLAKSILISGKYPTLCSSTLSFYRTIVENPQFLFIYSLTSPAKQNQNNEDDENEFKIQNDFIADDFHSWIEAAGHYLKTMFPVMAFQYFSSLKRLSYAFRDDKDHFLTQLVLCVLQDDQNVIKKLDNFTSFLDTYEMILNQISELEFSPLSQFLLSTLLVEAKRAHPESRSHYIVFGRIFKLLLSRIIDENVIHIEKLDRVAQLCNFTDQVPQNISESFIQIIDEITEFKGKLYLKKSAFTSFTSVSAIIRRVFNNPEQFLDIIQSFDFAQLLEQYRQKLQ
ncbi:hypothetical protein TRFO_23984 [Tritrichomonas foetus]|uniref:Uncharacterized protein n=1 Tax=Tritrichomonas foetus TaxID=1144522 RepID=A0A1J4K923_9EUKA|nr:hypothetical protein TRFO_23984 [Tritrichomonas foetus]|eukprot:OHT07715.1 hypothetical protein TRFO_23984 [Tritrichomonas foetus]